MFDGTAWDPCPTRAVIFSVPSDIRHFLDGSTDHDHRTPLQDQLHKTTGIWNACCPILNKYFNGASRRPFSPGASSTMADYDKAAFKVQEPLQDIYGLEDDGGIDHVYHVKARLLNDAIQEIRMGKYQVRPLFLFHPMSHPYSFTVDAFHSCRLWLVHR